MPAPKSCVRRWALAHQDFISAANAIEVAKTPKQAIGQIADIGSKFCRAIRFLKDCPEMKNRYSDNVRAMRDVVAAAIDIAVKKCEKEKRALRTHEIGVEYL